jgi:hypothetical protein
VTNLEEIHFILSLMPLPYHMPIVRGVQAAWDAAWMFPFILLFPWTATSLGLRRWVTTSTIGGDAVMRPFSDDPWCPHDYRG